MFADNGLPHTGRIQVGHIVVTRLVPTEIIVIVLVKELGKSVLFWIIMTLLSSDDQN